MSRVAYVNGTYQPHGEAVVHVEDRGFQFADGVYEVCSIFDGRLGDFDGHLTRLWRSLDELRIAHPMSRQALETVLKTPPPHLAYSSHVLGEGVHRLAQPLRPVATISVSRSSVTCSQRTKPGAMSPGA